MLLTPAMRKYVVHWGEMGSRWSVNRSVAQIHALLFLSDRPLAAADYLAIAQEFHTILVDHIPVMTDNMHNVARRFTLLIDTLYDEGVKLICSAAAPPDQLYPAGIASDAFRRTASRLAEMQSEDYLKRGHGVHRLTQ